MFLSSKNTLNRLKTPSICQMNPKFEVIWITFQIWNILQILKSYTPTYIDICFYILFNNVCEKCINMWPVCLNMTTGGYQHHTNKLLHMVTKLCITQVSWDQKREVNCCHGSKKNMEVIMHWNVGNISNLLVNLQSNFPVSLLGPTSLGRGHQRSMRGSTRH